MPLTYAASTVNLPAASIKSRWLEPYVSAAVNQKSIGLQPHGVFTGFIVAPGVAALSLSIQVDPTLLISGANVLVTAAQVTPLTPVAQYCITLLHTSDIPVDLSPVPLSSVVYVVLDAQYAVTVTSAAQVRVVTAAELADPPNRDFVLLAKVTLPGAAIPLVPGDINMGYRLTAGDSITSESRPTINLLPNGSFERDVATFAPTGWTSVFGTSTISVSGTVSRSGSKSLKIDAIAGPLIDTVRTQPMVVFPGVKYRVGAWIRSTAPNPIVGNGVWIQVEWYNPSGTLTATTTVEAPFLGASTVFEERKAELTAPAGVATARFAVFVDLSSGVLYLDDAEFSARRWEASADAGIGYAGGANWADGTTNPATTVEAQLDKIVTDLAGASGAAKVGNAPSKILANTFTQINTFSPPAAVNQAVIVKAFAAQAANVLEVQDDATALLTAIDKDGDIVFSAAARQLAWPDWNLTENASNEMRLISTAQPGSHLDFVNIPAGITQNTGVFATNTTGTSVGVSARADGTNWVAGSTHPIYIAPDANPEWSFEVGGVLSSINKTRIANVARATTAADAVNTEYLVEYGKPRNYLLNSGFDFHQRAITLKAHAALANVWDRIFSADRWYAAVTSDVNACGSSVLTGWSAVDPAPNSTRNLAPWFLPPVGNANAKMVVVQEIDRAFIPHMRGKTMTMSAYLFNNSLPAGATYQLKLVTGTGASTQTFAGGYTGSANDIAGTATNVNTLNTGWPHIRVSATGTVGAAINTAAWVLEISGLGRVAGVAKDGIITMAQAMLTEGTNTALLAPWARMHADVQTELVSCQAWYEKSYDVDTAPGTVTALGQECCVVDAVSNVPSIRFKVNKKKIPALAFYSPTAATADWNHSAGTTGINPIGMIATTGFTPDVTGAPNAVVASRIITGHWTADAEI